MGDYTLYCGDAEDMLSDLPEGLARCCVTSPPYYAQRSYLDENHANKARELGTESTPSAYVLHLVAILRAVRRVLSGDGTLWIVIGDSYATTTSNSPRRYAPHGHELSPRDTSIADVGRVKKSVPPGYKIKDLIGIPWMVAFALRDDGWYLRSDIIWHKPDAMPESVRDRPNRDHEYVFLLSKSKNYYYNHDAIKQPSIYKERRVGRVGMYPAHAVGTALGRGSEGVSPGTTTSRDLSVRNKRSVWSVNTASYAGAHFATFPPELVKTCVLAGSAPGDTVLDPFNGAGTTGLVALSNDRDYIGIDLNPEYLELSRARLDARA